MSKRNSTNRDAWKSLMERPPGQAIKGGGTYIYRHKLNQRELSCSYCLYYKRKNCTLSSCMCIEERIEAGGVPTETILRCLSESEGVKFKRRCFNVLNGGGEFMKTKDKMHETRWQEALREGRWSGRTMISVVFLLTADAEIWKRTRAHIIDSKICFEHVNFQELTEEQYALISAAKDLYSGSRSLCLCDLADVDMVSTEVFELVVTAMAIKRYGTGVLRKKGEK